MHSMTMKLIGTALLWVGLATLVYVKSPDLNVSIALVAALGFLSFASGLLLFAEGQKLAIIAGLQRDHAAALGSTQRV